MHEQERRTQRRQGRIRGGVDDLELWLEDLVGGGLAEAAARPWASFERMSERLVDAQARGLARRVRDLGGLPHRTAEWPERMLIDLGRLTLLIDAVRRLDSLEPDLRAEVRTVIGISERREDVLVGPAVHDVWGVVGRRVVVGERLNVQRTWLWGQQARRWALLLEFSVAGRRPDVDKTLAPGSAVEGSLCFYSGTDGLRALLKEPPPVPAGCLGDVPWRTVHDVLDAYAETLGRNPWQDRIPVALGGVVPHRTRAEGWCLMDVEGGRLPVVGTTGWHLLAISGGRPIHVFGEWDGFSFWPLTAAAEGRLTPLRGRAAA